MSLDPSLFYRYPHEFSGGQDKELVLLEPCGNPKFIICDESVSALDVSASSSFKFIK